MAQKTLAGVLAVTVITATFSVVPAEAAKKVKKQYPLRYPIT